MRQPGTHADIELVRLPVGQVLIALLDRETRC
jgi:hypothetical protein